MAILKLKGRITDDGKLEIELPSDVLPGEVDVEIRTQAEESSSNYVWKNPELGALIESPAKTGAEIVRMMYETNGWWDRPDIEDGQKWVEEQRQKRRERRNLEW